MTVIARITVREIHGIRRFLYPLAATLDLPETFAEAPLGLLDPEGSPVPSQVSLRKVGMTRSADVDFAVSIGPREKRVLLLCTGAPAGRIEDPLQIETGERVGCRQTRFRSEIGKGACLHQAVYDGIAHLAAPAAVTRNGEAAAPTDEAMTGGPLAARFVARGEHPDGCHAAARLDLTACKSWVRLTHTLAEPQPGDIVAFRLPIAVSSPVLTCDFGAGGGVYGRLDTRTIPEIVWSTEFSASGEIRWSLSTAGRDDYAGEEPSLDSYRPKCWFHLIDRNKSLAAAVTEIPADCVNLTASLRADGNCVLAFRLGGRITGAARFGACFHFLYDIPPVAAATNPQSILLPPEVDVALHS
jgi:hypothetical protein